VKGHTHLQSRKSSPVFQIPPVKKGWAIPHKKCPFLFDMYFLVKEITNLTSNCT
jgi:hypothetical protein